MSKEHIIKLHDDLTEFLREDSEKSLHDFLKEIHVADIAEIFQLLSEEQRSHVLFAMPSRMTAEVISLLDDAVQRDVVDDLDEDELTDYVSRMPIDDAADVLIEMSDEETARILEKMPDEKSEPIEQLMVHHPDSAGGIMTSDIVTVRIDQKVSDARSAVRKAIRRSDHTHYTEDLPEVFVLDDMEKPVGVIPVYLLIKFKGSVPIKEVYYPELVSVSVDEDQETVLQLIRKYDASSCAVVDLAGKLIGRITHDDLIDVADQEAEEDMLHMGGTDPSELDSNSSVRAAIVRLTWLLPCMIGMLTTGIVMASFKSNFEAEIFIALSFFVPLIGAMGGNSGVQTSTVVVRGLSTGEIAYSKFRRTMFRELRISSVMAPVCGMFGLSLVYFAFRFLAKLDSDLMSLSAQKLDIALSVGIALTCAILCATVLGFLLPFIFKFFKVDPAIAAGPIVTTMNDVIAVSIYLTISYQLIASVKETSDNQQIAIGSQLIQQFVTHIF